MKTRILHLIRLFKTIRKWVDSMGPELMVPILDPLEGLQSYMVVRDKIFAGEIEILRAHCVFQYAVQHDIPLADILSLTRLLGVHACRDHVVNGVPMDAVAKQPSNFQARTGDVKDEADDDEEDWNEDDDTSAQKKKNETASRSLRRRVGRRLVDEGAAQAAARHDVSERNESAVIQAPEAGPQVRHVGAVHRWFGKLVDRLARQGRGPLRLGERVFLCC